MKHVGRDPILHLMLLYVSEYQLTPRWDTQPLQWTGDVGIDRPKTEAARCSQ